MNRSPREGGRKPLDGTKGRLLLTAFFAFLALGCYAIYRLLIAAHL